MYFREIIIFRKEALGFLDFFRFKGSTGIPIFEICSKKKQQCCVDCPMTERRMERTDSGGIRCPVNPMTKKSVGDMAVEDVILLNRITG